jgi:membrane fusion protein (multidrug efflux system)
MRLAIATMLALCALALPAQAQQGAPSTVPVGTVSAELKPIARATDFVGRIEAMQRVEIRARVKGYLEEILFKDGDLVKEGTPLYRIEKGLFQADVEQAQGALERSKAAHTLAVVQLQRAEELLARSAGSVVARDQALAQEQQTNAAISTDEASLMTAKINLGYTDIVAPISGRIGRTNITKGNVVGPDSGPLTVIVSQDPMYVTFPVSQREFLRLRGEGQPVELKEFKVQVRFSDGTTYAKTGQLDFVDVTVNRATDTVLVRAVMPNPDNVLRDGQLVRVQVERGTPLEKVVIPQAALIADQQGTYVFVVEDGKAAIRRIKTAGEVGPNIAIDSGLKPGDLVVVEGLQSLRAGTPVRATPMPEISDRS